MLVFLSALFVAASMARAQESPSLEAVLGGDEVAGYARAQRPHPFTFPLDHGPHPQFKHEWWYFTGNVSDGHGRDFGFQLTFFRIALSPNKPVRDSAWAADQVYMGHFALSDIGAQRFLHVQRFSRAAAGLAGAQVDDDGFRVWLENWQVRQVAPDLDCLGGGNATDCLAMRLAAIEPDFALNLSLSSLKPLVLQGEAGLSRKSPQPGNASHYYSFTRLAAHGEVSVAGQRSDVSGLAWMDREWSTSALGEGQVGWDWFALQFDDGSELMWYDMRRADGRVDPNSQGVLAAADGAVTRLDAADVQVQVIDWWRSPHSGIRYPAHWRLVAPQHDLSIEVVPRQADQELHETVMKYWEGAVSVSGTRAGRSVAGTGYVELAGYQHDQADAGRRPND